MMLAARGAFLAARRKLTARSYVQDGLVAMWDGLENAGWGVHDSAATVWKDLIGNRDWTLGPSTSYEWKRNSFDAKTQFASTQNFIEGGLVNTIEFCVKIKDGTLPLINTAYIILGRDGAIYYGLLLRNVFGERALMCCRSYFSNTVSEYLGEVATFSFPKFNVQNTGCYFNGVYRSATSSNTLDYSATNRGTMARIGGIASSALPIEVFSIRLYSRALTAEEIDANSAIDKERFKLP